MVLERCDAARVVGGGDPQEDADHKGQDDDHNRDAHCTRTPARRQVRVLPVDKLGASPAFGQVGRLDGLIVRRGVVKHVLHVLSIDSCAGNLGAWPYLTVSTLLSPVVSPAQAGVGAV